MSMYLGKQKVGETHIMGTILDEGDEVITAAQKEKLNDAVNYRVGEFTSKTIPQMIEKLKQQYLCDINVDMDIDLNGEDEWTRPEGWPDLDSLNLQMSGDDYIYMTYDANQDVSAIALYCIAVSGSPAPVVTMGHISNGEYVVDETISENASHQFIRWLDDVSGYIVVRVTGDIKYCYCIEVTNVDGQKQAQRCQPIIERIAYVPHLDYFSTGSNCWGTYLLQREKVGNGDGSLLKSISSAYEQCSNLRDLDISNLYTLNVTTMDSAFSKCCQLKGTLDLSHFNVEKVTYFGYMFYYCFSLSYINLTGWQTDALTTTGLNSMFNECRSLKRIYGIEDFKTSNCTQMGSTFNGCRMLDELKLNKWNTSNITTFSSLFSSCYKLKTLEISNWKTSALTTLTSTFANCYSLEELDLSGWDVSKVNNVYNLFSNCRSLKKLNITGWKINSTTSFAYVFANCYCLEHIDIGDWHITNTCTTIYQAFSYCIALQELNIPNDWDVSGLSSSNSTANSLFQYCWSLKRITGISNWNFQLNNSLQNMFYCCYSLEEVDVSGWNVSTTTSLQDLFSNCFSLKQVNLSSWTPTNCQKFSGMFYQCFNLEEINFTNFISTNCTTMASMFNGCFNLKRIVGNLNNWNVSNVTQLNGMFYNCWSLQGPININNWDVSKVTTVNEMFNGCHALKEISLSNWNLAKCTTIASMFRYCHTLEKLTLTNWSLPALTTAPDYIFSDCWNLKEFNGLAIPLNHRYNNSNCLTHTSLLNILNALPQVSTSRTLTLGSININKLTAAEKAIATNKGWTLAT